MRLNNSKNCIVCGNNYVPQGTISQVGTSKYCSLSCYWKFMKGKKGNREGTGLKKECIICGKTFKKGGRTQEQFKVAKCCSQNCYHKSRKSINYGVRQFINVIFGLVKIVGSSKNTQLPIILKIGKNVPNLDILLKTVLLFAVVATRNATKK